MIVLDASATIELLLRTSRGEVVAEHLASARGVYAPSLLDLEVAQVLRRLESTKVISKRRATEALTDYRSIAITRHEHEPLLERIWALRSPSMNRSMCWNRSVQTVCGQA